MKKFIVFLLVAVLFIPFLVLAEDTASSTDLQEQNQHQQEVNMEQNLEKIHSLQELKDYKVIKKEGNTLFGIKIKNLENGLKDLNTQIKNIFTNRPATTTATTTSDDKSLEKISNPGEIKFFEKIVKIGTALWGLRKDNSEHLGVNQLTPETISCLKPVIDKKDAAVTTSLASSSQQLIDATNARNNCQKTALSLTGNPEIVKAFKACKEAFNKAIKDSRTSAKKYREDAWKTYQQEVRACYKTNTASSTSTTSAEVKMEGGNVLMDDGGNNLDF